MARQKNEDNNVLGNTPQTGVASMTPPRRAGTKSQPATTNGKITQEQIARRAHEIWVKQGCKHGRDQENWFEAERQLRAELARK